MSEINKQIINCDLQNQLLNESQVLHAKQQSWSPNTLTEFTQKKRMNSIKIVYPQQLQSSYEERQVFTKSQTKKKVFERRRILTNSFKTQICSKPTKQETLQLKQQQNDSQSHQSYINKGKHYKKNIFFDQIIFSPIETLQSFRSHLKAVRQQNETYLKNKMNVIKQKIKRKIQNEPTQRSRGTFWSKKYEKTKDKTDQKQRKLKVQKYDEQFEEDMIRKSIQIQKCQVLNYNSQNKLSILQEEQKTQTKPGLTAQQKRSIKQHPIIQPKQQMIIKGSNKIKISITENQSEKEQNYKMMIVNRLSPLKNVVSVIKPEKSLEKKKINTGGLQVGLFFNIKALDQTPTAQNTSHKYSKSFDISLIKKIDKKLSQETTAHNFIKGSVIYRLLKERNYNKSRQPLTLQVQNSPKKIQIQNKIFQTKKQVATSQPTQQNKEIVQQPQKKKKVVILSNKDITKFKSGFEGRTKYDQTKNRIDQYEESFQSQLFYQYQQKKG